MADRQANGLAGVDLGDSPATNETSVAVEDLDAPGFVGDVQPVLVVDRDRSWFEKTTVV